MTQRCPVSNGDLAPAEIRPRGCALRRGCSSSPGAYGDRLRQVVLFAPDPRGARGVRRNLLVFRRCRRRRWSHMGWLTFSTTLRSTRTGRSRLFRLLSDARRRNSFIGVALRKEAAARDLPDSSPLFAKGNWKRFGHAISGLPRLPPAPPSPPPFPSPVSFRFPPRPLPLVPPLRPPRPLRLPPRLPRSLPEKRTEPPRRSHSFFDRQRLTGHDRLKGPTRVWVHDDPPRSCLSRRRSPVRIRLRYSGVPVAKDFRSPPWLSQCREIPAVRRPRAGWGPDRVAFRRSSDDARNRPA